MFSTRSHQLFRWSSLLAVVAAFALIISCGFRNATIDLGPHHTLLFTNFRIEYLARDGTDDGFADHLVLCNARRSTAVGKGPLRITMREPSVRFSFLPYQDTGSGWRRVGVPLWIFAAAALSLASLLWWNDLKNCWSLYHKLRGHCVCGYPRAGLKSGAPCPECGSRD